MIAVNQFEILNARNMTTCSVVENKNLSSLHELHTMLLMLKRHRSLLTANTNTKSSLVHTLHYTISNGDMIARTTYQGKMISINYFDKESIPR